MWRQFGLAAAVLGCCTCLAHAFTVSGTMEFFCTPSSQLEPSLGYRGYPKDTKVCLLKKNWLGQYKTTREIATAAVGTYSIDNINANPADVFRIRICFQTMKVAPDDIAPADAGKGRIRVNLVENYWESNDFQIVGNLTKNIQVSDNDSANRSAVLFVVDAIYRSIRDTGNPKRLPYLGTLEGQKKNGQIVKCPGPLNTFTDAIAWPGDFHIHLAASTWNAATVAHEFGHIIQYHSTSFNFWDLRDELNTHWEYRKSSLPVAYLEGWAEFFAATWLQDQHNVLVVNNNSALNYDIDFVKLPPSIPPNTNYPRGRYWDYWKAAAFAAASMTTGTDNSGEAVEGAVAQVFWKASASPGNFPAGLDPAWQVVQHGATATSRNKRKNFFQFYTTWMDLNLGNKQAFREACAEHGIVYSRTRLNKINPVANKGFAVFDFNAPVWVSKISKFQAVPMNGNQLFVGTSLARKIADVEFEITKVGEQSPINLANKDWIFVTGLNNWDWFAGDNTRDTGFYADLDATNRANKYFLVRSRAKADGTGTRDILNGPNIEKLAGSLEASDASGKNTATWWHEQRVLIPIKIDKVPPAVVNRKPAN